MARLTDRTLLTQNRARANGSGWFLFDLVASQIKEKLMDVNRRFTRIAVVSGQPAYWATHFPNATLSVDRDRLDLAPQSCDLVLHLMALHWADDPVGQLVQCKRALVPDGAFISVSFAGGTLSELRHSLSQAESHVMGGLSPRVLPMGDLRALGGLLQRAGYALPVADCDQQIVSYRDLFHLAQDLRAMGERNALLDRLRKPTHRMLFDKANQIYHERFGQDGRIPATFDLAFLTGWAPDASQPTPLRPGSAQTSLIQALNLPQSDDDD